MPANIYWTGTTSGDASVVTNYSTGALPATGDTLFIEASPTGTDVSITAGLSALSAVTLAALNISNSYTGIIGVIGSPPTYFQVGATLVKIGYGDGQGSTFIAINFGSVQGTYNITGSSGSSGMTTAGPLCLKGTHASNILNLISGTVSVAANATEVATFATVNGSGGLTLGPGVTLTAVNYYGGSLVVQSAITTLTIEGGAVETRGIGAITTANIYSGTLKANSTGTIGTLNIQSGLVDFSGNPAARTVTTINGFAGGSLNLNNGVKGSITITNPIVVKANPGQFVVTPWSNSSIAFS